MTEGCDSLVVVEQVDTTVEVVEEKNVVEVISEGLQGAPYEFIGGTSGQAWTALDGGGYGWADVHPHESIIIPFINESSLESTFSERFHCQVYILGSANVENHIISVEVGGIAEDFACVGMVKINAQNEWELNAKRMLFKSTVSANYLAFDDSADSWVYGELGDHSTGHRSASGKVVLNSNGTLPKSFAGIVIDVNYATISSNHFSLCDADIEYFTETDVVKISFSGLPQTGFIVL